MRKKAEINNGKRSDSTSNTAGKAAAAMRRHARSISWPTYMRRLLSFRNVFKTMFFLLIPLGFAMSWLSIWSEEWAESNSNEKLSDFDRCWKLMEEHDTPEKLVDAMNCFEKRHHTIHHPYDAEIPLHTTGKLKLIHDIEQLDYLRKKSILPSFAMKGPEAFMSLFKAAEAGDMPPIIRIRRTPRGIPSNLWKSIFHKNIYWNKKASLPIQASSTLSNHFLSSTTKVEVEFANNAMRKKNVPKECEGQDGIVVADNVLSEKALTQMLTFLKDSTIWYHMLDHGNRLEARLDDGLASPLLAQIATDLRTALPHILGKHELRYAWALKYDNSFSDGKAGGVGAKIHADIGAIHVRIWLTPNKAKKAGEADKSESSGMVLYAKEALESWTAEMYSDSKFLEQRKKAVEGGVPHRTIPYKQNRMVIFNCNLLHREEENLLFNVGYENRRIGLTLIFGKHCSERVAQNGGVKRKKFLGWL
eukprot:g4801.t1